MMNKKTGIFVAFAIVIIVATGIVLSGCQASLGDFTPLTAQQKADILDAYKIEFCGGEEFDPNSEYYRKMPLVWFDENGGKRDEDVFRYFGTYGDCIVMLRYGDNKDAISQPVKLPFPLYGLSRSIDFPMECDIILYNTNPNHPTHSDLATPLTNLFTLEHLKLSWLTDAQLEQLTNDLENWIKKGNY